MDDSVLMIGHTRYRKTPRHVFEVRLTELGALRCLDLPSGSTVEILDLPTDPQRYGLAISATHAFTREELFLYAHVTFWYEGDSSDTAVRNACDRRLRRIRQAFQDLIQTGYLNDGDGDEQRSRMNGKWYCGILYSRYFAAAENPVLAEFVKPIVERVELLLPDPR